MRECPAEGRWSAGRGEDATAQGDEGHPEILTTALGRGPKSPGMVGGLAGSKHKGSPPNTTLPAPAGPSHPHSGGNTAPRASRCREAPTGRSPHRARGPE